MAKLITENVSEIAVEGIPTLGTAGSNKIYSYPTTSVNNGYGDMTYTRDTVNGDFVTVLNAGLYFAIADHGGGTNQTGISVNAASLTATITVTTWAQGRRAFSHVNGAGMSATFYCNVGDIIRSHSDAGGTMGGGNGCFVVRKVG